MNAAAYLTSQGWRGSGHALHPDGKGISKPLLVSKKTNVLGVGKKAHDAYADQWWSRAFDETLSSLNNPTTSRKASTTDGAKAELPIIAPSRWTTNGGLYGGFVKGQGLKGTMGALVELNESIMGTHPPIKRRRLDNAGEGGAERDRNPTETQVSKRTSVYPSAAGNTKDGDASDDTTDALAKVSPLRKLKSTLYIPPGELSKKSTTDLDEGKIEASILAESTLYPKQAGIMGYNSASPNLNTPDNSKLIDRGKPSKRRNKGKERSWGEQGLIEDSASVGHKTEPHKDHRGKKRKRKRRKDGGASNNSRLCYTP
ncbi:MAG: hypothetical protein LQ337_002313 [Flavoplaca oasis]|nr:MAG: hypothetical protein LQ337_002313 [Flavoplaca oasis]